MDFSAVKNLTGIYSIRVQDYIYIGQASNMYMRWSGHLSKLRLNKHENNFMQRIFNKYGESAFTFEIVDETTKDDLISAEQGYLDIIRMFYPKAKILNLAPVAGSQLGFKHSAASKANMSAAKLGKNHSAEHRAKISAARLGNTSRVKTYDIILLAPSGERHGPITNLKAFSIEHGLNTCNIHSVVTGKRKAHKGWRLFEAL